MAGKQDSKGAPGREERLKAALRDNLRKRKERDRAEAARPAGDGEPGKESGI